MRRSAAILYSVALCVSLGANAGCGDKSPPALWPEPPPPALAEPIGVADPAAPSPAPPSPPKTDAATVGDPKVEEPPPKATEAKQER